MLFLLSSLLKDQELHLYPLENSQSARLKISLLHWKDAKNARSLVFGAIDHYKQIIKRRQQILSFTPI